jgi:hypothetical protein
MEPWLIFNSCDMNLLVLILELVLSIKTLEHNSVAWNSLNKQTWLKNINMNLKPLIVLHYCLILIKVVFNTISSDL